MPIKNFPITSKYNRITVAILHPHNGANNAALQQACAHIWPLNWIICRLLPTLLLPFIIICSFPLHYCMWHVIQLTTTKPNTQSRVSRLICFHVYFGIRNAKWVKCDLIISIHESSLHDVCCRLFVVVTWIPTMTRMRNAVICFMVIQDEKGTLLQFPRIFKLNQRPLNPDIGVFG